jgi:hypothetical protein
MKQIKNIQTKLKYTAFLFLIGITGLLAQESISTSGGNASGNGGSVSYSVGQLFYTAFTGNGVSVLQGVQQPYEISVVTGIDEIMEITLSVLIYPNPTTDFIILNTESSAIQSFRSLACQLFDMNGRLLESKIIDGSQTRIDMSQLSPATYFLKVSAADLNQFAEVPDENKEVNHLKSKGVDTKQMKTVKTFKIIKK